MIKLFDVENNELRLNEHAYAIEWLKDIRIAFPDPQVYMRVYRYIFYMTCPDKDLNVYANMPEQEKSEEILRMLAAGDYPGFIEDDGKIEKAIAEARKLYSTPTQEAYLAAKTMLEKLKKSFQTEEITWGGKDATGPALVAAMEKLPKLIQAYNETELKMDAELKSRARGNQMTADDLEED